MMYRNYARSLSSAAMVAFSLIGGAAPVFADNVPAQTGIRREAVDLTAKTEIAAREIQAAADMLHRFAGVGQINRESHYSNLMLIRDLVNDQIRPSLVRLSDVRAELPVWKQQSLDRMLASAQALAANTTSAIQAKKNAGSTPVPLNTEYRTLLAEISRHASDLVKASDAAGELARAQMKAVETGLPVL